MTRDVVTKESLFDNGLGTVDAAPVWESDPTPEGGQFARLDRAKDGRWFFSLTDMEEFNMAYAAVEVTQTDLARLLALLAPEPKPSDAEIEAAGKALYRRAFPWDEHNETSDEFRAIAKAVLLAARAARQTGGESE